MIKLEYQKLISELEKRKIDEKDYQARIEVLQLKSAYAEKI